MLNIEFLNHSHFRAYSDDRGIEQDICDYFTFEVPGARWMPMYKSGVWDGKTRLYNVHKKTLYTGLYDVLVDYCEKIGIPHKSNFSLKNDSKVDENDIKEYIKGLNLASNGKALTVRQYQIDSIIKAINDKRLVLLSPTSSGKSCMLYVITRWMLDHKRPILLLVPTTNLVEQMYSDFQDYSSLNGWDVAKNVQKIYSGFTKDDTHPCKISTWQSIYKFNISYFRDFKVVLGDECHLYAAKSLSGILEKCINAEYRIGLSGTLDNKKTINKLTLTGLFGKIHQVTTTKTLMDTGYVTKLKIKALLLKYPKEQCKLLKGMTYQQEMSYLATNPKRQKFITNLAINTKGNTLILFQFIKQGKDLYEMIKAKSDRPVFYISGEISPAERERIRLELNTHNNAIIVASVQTTSTGVNIPALDNVIFATPTKSVYRVLQSIGRVLRLKDGKIIATLFDIGDNITSGKKVNTTMLHFIERIKIYVSEKFEYKIIELDF